MFMSSINKVALFFQAKQKVIAVKIIFSINQSSWNVNWSEISKKKPMADLYSFFFQNETHKHENHQLGRNVNH